MSRSDVKNNRIRESQIMNCGEIATIIEYKSNKDIIVEFQTGEIINCTYNQFKKKTIKSKYSKTIFNIGYLSEGKYNAKKNNKLTLQYKSWVSMIERCYSKIKLEREPSYKVCTVCDAWLNFQNFAKWFDENYYTIKNDIIELDKDILHKGNKVYSSENCIFVPSRINCLFTKSDKIRGKYPIGVKYHKRDRIFESSCSKIINNKKKSIYLGRFNNPIEAFNVYKTFKENYIKEVADEYKDKIPKKLYDAMYNWKV